jgi:signal peptidase I
MSYFSNKEGIMEEKKKIDLKEIITYAIIIVTIVLIRIFLVTPVMVDGDSMNDTLLDNEVLILKKYDKSYKRFDVIVFKYKKDKLIKRVIGLPGEHIKFVDNKLYVNNVLVREKMITKKTNDFDLINIGYKIIPDGYYFVMGDNRSDSTDGRHFGLISEKDILGSTNLIVFPFTKFGKINEG